MGGGGAIDSKRECFGRGTPRQKRRFIGSQCMTCACVGSVVPSGQFCMFVMWIYDNCVGSLR